MIIIGITGGIGSGKSLVCEYLEKEYDACVLMADDVGHEVMAPDGCAYPALKELLGEQYVKEDGTFDRKKIGDRAFKEPELLQKMNAIIHPAVHETIAERLSKAEKEGCQIGVIEAALLIEADYRDLCTEYWYVHTDALIRRKRLLASRDLTTEKIEDIMSRQLDDDTFRKECEFELENGDDFEQTKMRIDERIKTLRTRG